MIEPIAYTLRYHRADASQRSDPRTLDVAVADGLPVDVEVPSVADRLPAAGDRPSVADGLPVDGDRGDLAVEFGFDGEVLILKAKPRTALVLDACTVTFAHDFPADERILLNGYQSWTDTWELPPYARMRGLHGVPPALVRRYVLDGGGDYRFTDYPHRRGCLHGFTYAHFRRGDSFTLLASLREDDGFTLIRTDATAGRVTLEKECPVRALASGEEIELCRFARMEGSVDEVYDRWFALMGVVPRSARPLVGFSSWYRHYAAIDAATLMADLTGVADVLDRTDCTGCFRVFQIDDGYAKAGDWLAPDAERFPQGFAPLARAIVAAGLVPGLWVSPFVCERDSRLFSEHADWLLRDDAGVPVTTGCHWSGGFALDTRNPAVRAYVSDVIHTMTREWGFRLLKVDFLYAACMRPHDGLNRGALMADGIDLVRRAAGDDVALDCCGVPLASVFGMTEYCRIGCDVGLDWDDRLPMRLLHRERVSTRRSLADTRGRAPLDGRAFGCDPDVFFLRDEVRLTQAQRTMLLESDARGGSVLLSSDDMGTWDDAARAAFQAAVEVLRGRRS